MKATIKSGTIKYQGKNIPVRSRECDAAGNTAIARDGRTFFSSRKAGYRDVTPPPEPTETAA